MSRAELKPHGASSGCSQHSRSRLGHKRLSTALLHMPSQQPPGPQGHRLLALVTGGKGALGAMSQHSNLSQPGHAYSGLSWYLEQLGGPELSPPPAPTLAEHTPPPPLPSRPGCEHLWTRPRADAPAEFAAPGDTPLPSQTLKIRLCQLQKRCHHEWKLWGLGHRVTSRKDMDSYNVSLICGMGVRAGLRAAVSSISIIPHKLTPLTLTPLTRTRTEIPSPVPGLGINWVLAQSFCNACG